jgi:hypothetical protein
MQSLYLQAKVPSSLTWAITHVIINTFGGTTRNIKPQISKTYSTLRQHRTHIKKKSEQNIYLKVTQVM